MVPESAFAGCPSGQCNLRLCYASGIGTDKNETKSFEWYLKSAGEYHAVTQKYVGVLL